MILRLLLFTLVLVLFIDRINGCTNNGDCQQHEDCHGYVAAHGASGVEIPGSCQCSAIKCGAKAVPAGGTGWHCQHNSCKAVCPNAHADGLIGTSRGCRCDGASCNAIIHHNHIEEATCPADGRCRVTRCGVGYTPNNAATACVATVATSLARSADYDDKMYGQSVYGLYPSQPSYLMTFVTLIFGICVCGAVCLVGNILIGAVCFAFGRYFADKNAEMIKNDHV